MSLEGRGLIDGTVLDPNLYLSVTLSRHSQGETEKNTNEQQCLKRQSKANKTLVNLVLIIECLPHNNTYLNLMYMQHLLTFQCHNRNVDKFVARVLLGLS